MLNIVVHGDRFEIFYDENTGEFYSLCNGKNRRNLQGDNLILSLARALEKSTEEIKSLQKEVSRLLNENVDLSNELTASKAKEFNPC